MNDMIPKGTRHFATFQRRSVMILGFNAPSNTVFLVNLAAMPAEEADELRKLALSPAAQKADTMSLLLQQESHTKSGRSWFEHLWQNRLQWMAHTFPANLSDMDPNQSAFFRGHGKSLTEKPDVSETNHVFNSGRTEEAVPDAPLVDDLEFANEEAPARTTLTAGETRSISASAPTSQLESVLGDLAKAITYNTNTLLDMQKEIKTLAKKIPGKPGPKPGSKNKPKVVEGKPTPVSVFPSMLVEPSTQS